MTIAYSLAPCPKWYIADLTGKPLAGGYLATFSNLDHTALNPVFEDPAGLFPWPYVTIPNIGSLGILFDENGAQGPFYFKTDSAVPDQLYYLEVYDSKGILQWTIDNFTPTGGGGGSIITTALDLENLIANNVMYRNIGSTPIVPGTFLKLAPGANAGLVQTASNCGPDICFIKNNTSATDSLSFPKFILGTTPFTGDVTPVDYLHFECTGAGSAETQKIVQYPITQGIQNLSNQDVTLTLWAKSTSSSQVTLYWKQFCGDGAGASVVAPIPIQTLTLSTSWQKFVVSATVPDATGLTLGGCGNDGLFLQIQYPLNATCNVDLQKPCIYLGAISPDQDYRTYDMIDALINTPRTGDYRTSINQFAPFGWVACDNGTIGNASSNASSRASDDTFPLFDFLWNISAPYTPMFTSAGAAASRGATSIADFTANNQISLTNALGNVMAGTSSSLLATQNFTTSSGSATNLTVTNAASWGTGTPVFLTGSPPAGLSINTLYYSIFVNAVTMQLASTLANATTATPISFTAASGSGTVGPVNNILGSYTGEATHTLTVNEMPAHTHSIPQSFAASNAAAGSGVNASQAGSENTGSTGGGAAHNNVQPTLYSNVFLKL